MEFLIVFIFFIWFILLYLGKDSFLYFLILMEGFMVLMFIFLHLFVVYFYYFFDFMYLFLSIMVIEGVFGLCILICLNFYVSSDMYDEGFYF